MNDETPHVPSCVGIILDGNRRWAREKGLPTLEGHRKGYAKLKNFTEWSCDAGVKFLVAYVFSTENWNRPPEEVQYLMNLNRLLLKQDRVWAKKEGVRIRVIGSRERLDADIVASIQEIEKETASYDRITLVLALNYGGRTEIAEAAQSLAEQGKTITEQSLGEALWSHDIPDPELIIRTSGEQRLSGFLTWKSVYSELLFLKKNFPDIEQSDVTDAVAEYARRGRRFGA